MLEVYEDDESDYNEDGEYFLSQSSSKIDLRLEAEKRVKYAEELRLMKQQQSQISAVQVHHQQLQHRKQEAMYVNAANSMNNTPAEAKLAEIDYKFNGGRARVNTGEFIPPRWMLDAETNECILCRSLFDWINRRHHCRHCGRIVCSECSSGRSILPQEYGLSDPQRVCSSCYEILAPVQATLTCTMANHQKSNPIDSTKCLRRYLNMPFSLTLGSELRKASYSVYNLFETETIIKDRIIPSKLLARSKGVAFLTVIKGGFGLAGSMGTGLVIGRLPSGDWSAPSAIGTIGVSWGALIGADITDYIIFLQTIDAVRAFAGLGQVSIGAGVDVAIGPIGFNSFIFAMIKY